MPGIDAKSAAPRAHRRGRGGRAARHRLHLHRGPDLEPDGQYLLFSDMPGDMRRRWDEPGGGAGGAASPSNKCNGMTLDDDGSLLVCEHVTSSVVRIEPDGRHARDARQPLPGQGAQQPERRRRRARTARSTSPTRPTGACRASASSASRSSTSRASTGSRPGGGEPELLVGRVRAAERAVLLARRVAAVRQRHRPRAHPRLRRRRRRHARERPHVLAEGIGTGDLERAISSTA